MYMQAILHGPQALVGGPDFRRPSPAAGLHMVKPVIMVAAIPFRPGVRPPTTPNHQRIIQQLMRLEIFNRPAGSHFGDIADRDWLPFWNANPAGAMINLHKTHPRSTNRRAIRQQRPKGSVSLLPKPYSFLVPPFLGEIHRLARSLHPVGQFIGADAPSVRSGLRAT